MTQKEKIIELLKANAHMTQVQLATHMYGDNHHSPNIYSSLMSLVNAGVIARLGNNPSYYSLSDSPFDESSIITKKQPKKKRDVSNDIITSETINEKDNLVLNSHDYSIYDSVLRNYLPLYFNDITKSQIEKWVKSFNYKAYNDYISAKLDELSIFTEYRKRKFDHFVWSLNKKD